jgi:hypothetical protein
MMNPPPLDGLQGSYSTDSLTLGIGSNALLTPAADSTPDSPDSKKSPAKKRKRDSTAGATDENDRFAEIDSLLAQKRKPRMKTSCHPCRKRKVGCDRQQPCHTCVERRHPEFCVYESGESSKTPASGTNAGTILNDGLGGADVVTVPRKTMQQFLNKVEHLESLVSELKTELRMSHGLRHGSNGSMNSPGMPFGDRYSISSAAGDRDRQESTFEDETSEDAKRDEISTNALTGQTVHVGSHSIPALMMSLIKGQAEAGDIDWSEFMNGGGVLPLLGLDNETATYPFLDLWANSDENLVKVSRIADMLPGEEDCNNMFHVYKTVSQIVFPAVANMGRFSDELMQFHLTRAQEPRETGITETSIYGKSLTWIALLFAILASGCHFSDMYERRARTLTSKAFICCSFECLRLINFLSHPTEESLQTMLVFLNTLLNMYNAGVSWAMLGLCIRLAQSLGLHRESRTNATLQVQNERAKIWWAILWQDSLISIVYDRGGCIINMDSSRRVPSEFDTEPGTWGFERCMYEVAKIGLQVVKERDIRASSFEVQARMEEHERDIAKLENSANRSMQDLSSCREMKDKQQNLILQVHKSYLLSEIFRPSLSPVFSHKTGGTSMLSSSMLRMRGVCIENLVIVVRAWSDLMRFGSYPNRSWPAMHRALSSALLLGILKEHERDQKVLALLNEFLRYLEETVQGLDEQDIPDPLKRSLTWIRRLITPKGSGGPGSQTSGSPSSMSLENMMLELEGSPWGLLERMMWPGDGTP